MIDSGPLLVLVEDNPDDELLTRRALADLDAWLRGTEPAVL